MSDNLPIPVSANANITKPVNAKITKPAKAPAPRLPAASLQADIDPIWLLLQDKRSPATRRAYKADLDDFFGCLLGHAASKDEVREFAGQDVPMIAQQLVLYQENMRVRGLATATSNRRISAIKSLLKFCLRLGLSKTDGRGLVDGQKSKSYRDTRGTDLSNIKRLLALPDRTSLRGKRDYALLRLLCDNALRRAEVCALNVGDFWPEERRLAITGKGSGGEKVWVTLHPSSAAAVAEYLMAAGHWEGPLFVTCDHRPHLAGARLGMTGLYDMVGTYGLKIGLKLTPHKLRHSAITAALDKTGGDVRRVQKLSRHVKLETLIIYDDNRADHQGEITLLLGDLLEG